MHQTLDLMEKKSHGTVQGQEEPISTSDALSTSHAAQQLHIYVKKL